MDKKTQVFIDNDENRQKILQQTKSEDIQNVLRTLEEQVRYSEHQLEIVMSAIAGGMKSSYDDENFTYEYVSPEAAALFGYTVDEFLEMSGGTAVGACYAPDRKKAVEECRENFKNGNEVYTLKYRVRCKDGSLKWVLDSGRKVTGRNGETFIFSIYLDITKEEQNTREIVYQKQLLQSIYDTVPCGILRFIRENGNYDLISLNLAAQQLLGYKNQEEGIADWHNGIVDNVLEEDRESVFMANEALKKPGDQVKVYYRAKHEDGSIRCLSGTNTLLFSENGRDTLQRTIFDVTELRVLQEQLEKEREMYQLAMESSSAIMYEYKMDTDTLSLYVSKQNEGVQKIEISGYRSRLELGMVVHPDDISAAVENMCQGRTEIFEGRFMLLQESSDYQWMRSTSKLVENAGQAKKVVGTLRNIEQEKSGLFADMEILNMHKSTLQVLSNVYTSIYYIDLPFDKYYGIRLPDYGTVAVPRKGSYRKVMTGYLKTWVHPDDFENVICYAKPKYLMECLNDRQRLEVEFRHKNGDKEPYWLRIEFSVVSRENGKVKNVVCAFRNITESRRMELIKRHEEEEAKKALEDAYAEANRANHAKSDFLSKMSHDMRTPMNAIMGMTVIAKENMSDREKLEDCLNKIHLSSRHLLNLINEVLDMSKIENGSISLNESAFNLRELIEETEYIIRPDMERKQQQFTVDISGLVHETVLGDVVRIKQILLNLLSNSMKYTPDNGKITLTFRESAYFSKNVKGYTFVVEDNGIGMSKEFQKKIFTPFSREEDSRVSQIQGTGLGMTITKNLINMMDGTIQIESELDKGTRVTVSMNFKTVQHKKAKATASADSHDSDKKEVCTDFKNKVRILLVEDNSLNREIARYMLEEMKVVVEEAEDGGKALKMFEQSEYKYYDMIFMDIQMPVMDGYQTVQAIRRLERKDAGSVPIIALTANAFAEDVSRARNAGMNAHLSKPLEPEALASLLSDYFG